jgi:hypothetical protein
MGLLQLSGRPNLPKVDKPKPIKPSPKKAAIKDPISRPKNPKKLIETVFAILVVALIALTAFYYIDNKNNSKSSTTANADPCAFFTLDDAKSILGNNSQEGGVAPLSPPSANDFSTITCIYTQKLDPKGKASSVQTPKSVSIVVRSPKTDLGKTLVQFIFTGGKPKEAQAVSSYGEKAYWDPTMGALNILKNGKWITLSNGVTAPASSRTLDDSKKLANIVIQKL